MTLQEKIDKMVLDVEEIKKNYPNVKNVWFEFEDIPLKEIQETAKKYKRGIEYRQEKKAMVLQLSCADFPSLTCFCYSVLVGLKGKLEYVEKYPK